MPTRKQRRRAQKGRRHDYEYETIWVDPVSGEEVEPPEDFDPGTHDERENGKPNAKSPAAPKKQGGSARPVKVPPQPSWSRAVKRSLLIGVVIFAAFYLVGSKNGSPTHRVASAALISVIYAAIFIPFTYWIDGFSYKRWQRRAEQQGQKRTAKSR
jgi:hypothetical protein